ncbi:hypothetical protein BpHYR1_009561 [Brachionus plicatilis]|uniref:Uncharacterized protein n=1 Tax=Brachionus plicatilis TaxID=10195 RepID=A0A3M7QI84_BRAPC|nr:hypothetical protein BpHYR1_009561 [Brachionus plicatilis]
MNFKNSEQEKSKIYNMLQNLRLGFKFTQFTRHKNIKLKSFLYAHIFLTYRKKRRFRIKINLISNSIVISSVQINESIISGSMRNFAI